MSGTATGAGGAQVPESNITRFPFADPRAAVVWLVARVYLEYLWLVSGLGKLFEPGWIFGDAVRGFSQGAMAQTGESTPRLRAGTPPFWRAW